MTDIKTKLETKIADVRAYIETLETAVGDPTDPRFYADVMPWISIASGLAQAGEESLASGDEAEMQKCFEQLETHAVIGVV